MSMVQTDKKFMKRIMQTQEENEDYTTMECFVIDSKRYPKLYDALWDSFHMFWLPRTKRDKVIYEKLRQHRESFFGPDSVRSSCVSLGDLLIYLSKEAKRRIDRPSFLEDHLHVMMDAMDFYNLDMYGKRKVANKIGMNNYYYSREDIDGDLYSMFGFPRDKGEYRMIIDTILNQYVYLYEKGCYENGYYEDIWKK